MRSFGRYHGYKEVASTGAIHVWQVRSGTDVRKDLVLKCVEGRGSSLERFAASAAFQDVLARKFPDRWLPVSDLEVSSSDAWYVSPFCPVNLASLAERRFRPTGPVLSRILLSILESLELLRGWKQRPHANLKPGNVFLAGDGPWGQRKILLSDPAPFHDAQKARFDPDLRALGEIIYLLAGRRTDIDARVTRVPAEEDWRGQFGSPGKGWLALCSELLDPNGRYQKEGYAALCREIRKLGRPTGRGKWYGAAAGVALVALGIASHFIYQQHFAPFEDVEIEEKYIAYRLAYEEWLETFARSALRRASELDRDEHLSGVVLPHLRERGARIAPTTVFGALIPTDPRELPPNIETDTGLRRRVAEADRFLQDLLVKLDDWNGPEEAGRWEELFAQRGWENAAAELTPFASSPPLDSGLFDHLVEASATLVRARSADRQWEELRRLDTPLARLNDPLLAQLEAYQFSRVAEATGLPDLITRLRSLANETEPHRDLVATPGFAESYDYDLFREELRREDPVLRQPGDLVAWLQRIDDFRRIADPRQQQRQPMEEMDGQILRVIERLNLIGVEEESTRLGQEREGINRIRLELGRLPAIAREEETLREGVRNLLQRLSQLRDDANQTLLAYDVDPAEWIALKREEGLPGGGILEPLWVQRRNQLLDLESPATLADGARLFALNRRLDQIRSFLAGLDRLLEPDTLPLPGIGPELRSAAEAFLASERDNSLLALGQRALAREVLLAEELDRFAGETEVEAQRKAFTDLRLQTVQVVRGLAEGRARLDRDLPYDEEMESFLVSRLDGADPVLTALRRNEAVNALLTEFNEHRAIYRGEDPLSLLRMAGEETLSVSRRLTAWNALGRFPSWPVQRDALDQVLAIVRGARETGVALPGKPQRWVSLAVSRSQRADLHALFRHRELFEASPGDLPAEVRLDYLVFAEAENLALLPAFHRAAGDLVETRKQEFIDRIRSDTEVAGLERTSGLLRYLREEIDPFAEVAPLDPSTLGPGSLPGWQTREEENGDRVIYSWGAYDLPFRIVETARGERFFLAEQELPVGLFLEWLDQIRGWRELAERVGDYDDPGFRWGPVTWTPRGFLDRGADYTPQWLNLDPVWMNRVYPEPLAQAIPIDTHPIQYIPPHMAMEIASIFGAVLPTPDVFAAALARTDPSARERAWLRGQRWARLHRHIWQVNSELNSPNPPWPDAGIFLPHVDVPQGSQAQPAVESEGGIWFAEVHRESSGPFFHLIGNVAEFLHEPETDTFFVVGGSSLSPPEIDPTEPLPLPPRHDHRGFSDVGMRLAIPAPLDTPGYRFLRHLRSFTIAADQS